MLTVLICRALFMGWILSLAVCYDLQNVFSCLHLFMIIIWNANLLISVIYSFVQSHLWMLCIICQADTSLPFCAGSKLILPFSRSVVTPLLVTPLLPIPAATCLRLPPRAGRQTTTHPPMIPRVVSGLESNSELVPHRLGLTDHHNPVLKLVH